MHKPPKKSNGGRHAIENHAVDFDNTADAKLECRVKGDSVELLMYGDIGEGFGEITPANVRNYLNQNKGKKVLVRIHSKGGFALDANSIYNALIEHDGGVDTRNDGIVASAAVLPLLAGESIEMAQNGMLMIHDPYSGMIGGARDFRRQADTLDKLRDIIANSYAERTSLNADDIRQMMSDETWMTADEALAKGFVNKVIGSGGRPKEAVNQAMDAIRNQLKWISGQRESLASFLNRVPAEVPEDDPQPNEEEVMDKQLRQQCVALGMPVNATDEEALKFALERMSKPAEQTQSEPALPDIEAIVNKAVTTALSTQQQRFDAEQTRQNEVRAICNKFNQSDMIEQFISDKTPIADVKDAILNRLHANNPPAPEDNPENTGGKPKGADAKYDEAFKNYQENGGTHSREDFIGMMKDDSGDFTVAS